METSRGVQVKVLVVCGAGASSTFMALRLRRLAAERGMDMMFHPVAEAVLTEHLAGASAVLVGPHLANRFADLATQARAAHAVAVLMTEQMVHEPSAHVALDAAIAALDQADGAA